MSDAPRIVLRPNPSITPEQARDARAKVWSFIIQCREEKQRTAHPAAPNDAKERSSEIRAKTILHQDP